MSKAIEYIGDLQFPAQPYDLASMPDNKRAAKDAREIMPLLRMAATFLHEDDKALEKRVRQSGDLEIWATMAEQFVAASKHKQQEADLLNAGYARLEVVLERIVGREVIEADD